MNININIQNLVRQLLPPHKRQPGRRAFLWGLLETLQNLFNGFYAWRENTRVLINVNAQVRVLEGYLRKKYNTPLSIRITNITDGLLQVGLEEEGETMMAAFGREEEQYVGIPLETEFAEKYGDVDFVVHIPASLNIDKIDAEIQKYKPALTRYKIIQT